MSPGYKQWDLWTKDLRDRVAAFKTRYQTKCVCIYIYKYSWIIQYIYIILYLWKNKQLWTILVSCCFKPTQQHLITPTVWALHNVVCTSNRPHMRWPHKWNHKLNVLALCDLSMFNYLILLFYLPISFGQIDRDHCCARSLMLGLVRLNSFGLRAKDLVLGRMTLICNHNLQ